MQSFISRAFKVLFLAATLLLALVHDTWAQTNVIPDSEELAVLKKVYDSLGGAGWTNKTNWPTPGNWPASATSAQFGTWRGITVTNGDITAIALNSNNLVGKIPSNIGILTKLTAFRAQANTISGKIPVSICSLVNLKILHLYTNKLTGSIPTGVGAMTSLEDVELQGNLLTGPIPSGFGNLTHLVNLFLFSNDLSGKIPHELGGASDLQSLQLQGNELTESIPKELANLAALRNLTLAGNHLVGPIPPQLGALSNLEYLHFHSNELTGSIPPELGNLSSLRYLRLSDNHLSGTIPSTLGNITQLTDLYLEENQLRGSIPPALGELSHLVNLSVKSNLLTGKVPGRFGKLTSLRTLYLQDNDLEGGIHDSLQYMSQLRIFYVSSNSLSGSLPSWIGSRWQYLTHLAVFDNLMSGPLPESLGMLTAVRYFNVSNNDFEGRIPAGCEGWTELVTWSSYNNHFSGTLHANLFANKPALGGVNVSGNQFEGAFPSILGSGALTSLNASNNRFTTLPAGLLAPSANALAILNFGNNELTTLPDLVDQGNKPNLIFTVSNNRLDFTALELTRNAGIKTVTLLPQKNFKDIASVTPEEGQPLVIPARPRGIGTLAWEKLQADGVTWSNVDGLNQDDQPKNNFRRNAFAKATDEGMYRFSIAGTTGSFYQGIVLRSEPIRVKEPLTIVLDDWAFQYRYDGRRRMTHKKVPGAGWVYMVYDDRDRPVLTQDAEQRTKKQWSFTKYDALNRPVMTGLYTHGTEVTQEGMSDLISATNFYETFSTTGSTTCHGYSNNVFPINSTEILTVTYYDNYDFIGGWGKEYGYAPDQITDQDVNGEIYEQPDTKFPSVIGQVTGTKIRTLEPEPVWMQTVTYYDDRYRPVQVISDNYKKGTDRVTNVYDFVGKVLATKTDHQIGTITWRNGFNVTITDDKLAKSTTTVGWGTSGASSVEQIPANTPGWIDFTLSEISSRRLFGLSDDLDQDYTSVDFGFHLNNSALTLQANGTSYPITGNAVVGDKFRIVRDENGVITFYRNGIRLATGAVSYTSTLALMADVAFYSSKATIGRVKMSAGQGQQQIVARHMDYDHAGRLQATWHELNNSNNRILLVKNEYNELGQLIDKKLHSTVSSGADAKQSVDYRYNIRGWLTSINNAALTSDANDTNDDTNDLFGMNLGYNSGLGLSNDPQFNGNISAIQYSKDWGKGDVKQTGYAFKYDPMNRLTDAAHKQLAAPGSWESGGFDEGDIKYDLNGNIEALKRKGKGGVLIDDLKYTYSTPDISPSNKLLYVEDLSADAANKGKGFVDGNQGMNQDYTYDANGNMTRDLNKGIGTSTTDAINVIAYNHLNLPQMVSKGGSTIRYVYDATGRKLAQYVTSGASQKRTDYAGEFIYEDHALQFVNHEEGRIVVAKTKLMYTNSFDAVTADMLSINTGLSTYVNKGEKYVTVSASNSSSGNGVFPIGGPVYLKVNERYRVRVKAYAGSSPAYLKTQVKSGATVVSSSTALIPGGSVNECWIEQVIETPPTGTNLTLEAGVVWNTVTAGERIYLNEFEIVKLETTAQEYQYHLKDHLGNVRLTFTTKEDVETNKATMEEAVAIEESNQFQRYEDMRLSELSLFDHTNDNNPTSTAGRAILLRGGDKETAGLLKTLSVMPGDVVHMKVYAKYIDPNPEPENWSGALTTLVAALANGQAGTVTDGQGYPTNGMTPFPFIGLNGTGSSTEEGPQAYLNYLMFDRDFKPLVDDPSQSWFVRLSDGPKENKTTILANPVNGVLHELMEATVTVKQAGYMYIYLSNEETSPVEVFFDDFEVVHTKGPVVQGEEYYPFGLTFNHYQRENTSNNQYLYGGKERQDELGLNWLDYGARMYMPETGRWGIFDPKANKLYSQTPYGYAVNNPINFLDRDGRLPIPLIYFFVEGAAYVFAAGTAMYIVSNPQIMNIPVSTGVFVQDGSATLEAKRKGSQDKGWTRYFPTRINVPLSLGQPMGNNMEPEPHNPRKGDPNRRNFLMGGIAALGLGVLNELQEYVGKLKSDYMKANGNIDKGLEEIYDKIIDAEIGSKELDELIIEKKLLENLRSEQEKIIEGLDGLQDSLREMSQYRSVQQDNTSNSQNAYRAIYIKILQQIQKEATGTKLKRER